jgi:hypothetical protein
LREGVVIRFDADGGGEFMFICVHGGMNCCCGAGDADFFMGQI